MSRVLFLMVFTGDMRQVEGLTAADVWSYYCRHMDVVKIVAWIDVQFSAESTSVPLWPLTEPVSSDMIAELHTCPARVADYLLDRLAGYVLPGTLCICNTAVWCVIGWVTKRQRLSSGANRVRKLRSCG